MAVVINDYLLHILPDASALYEAAAQDFIREAILTIHKQPFFTVVLAGGETPKLFYDTLVQCSQTAPIPWQKIKFFFGDERYVPKDNAASNYHVAYAHLFSKVPVLPEHIYPMPTDLKDPMAAAEQYEQTLRSEFQGAQPLFDLVYLGLGANAHTASLMPDSELVKNYLAMGTSKLVDALWVPKLQMYRMTLTPPALNHCKKIGFLVTGEEKAIAVRDVLQGPFKPLHYPAQLIRCEQGKTVWYLDEKAAIQLQGVK